MKSASLTEYESSIQKFIGNQEVHFFWKARVGLYTLLKSMDVGPGDEVILPAYTCVVVPSAIIYLGAKPVYLDIRADTFNTNPELLESCITPNTKVIICQNTYGLSSDLEKVTLLAKKYDLFTIEDCTHGFGGHYNGVANGLNCNAAIYSTQWNKPFSTGVGGFAVVKDKSIANKVREMSREYIAPSTSEVGQLRLLMFARKYFLNQLTYWPLLKLYRFLSASNIVVGSSSKEEISSPHLPKDFLKRLSDTQARAGTKALNKLDADLELRKHVAQEYTRVLLDLGKNHVKPELHDNHSFLKYPLLVIDRAKFMENAEAARIELGDWFTSPLHPVEKNLNQWNFEIQNYPVAASCAASVINLPTTSKQPDRVIAFLKENCDLILDAQC